MKKILFSLVVLLFYLSGENARASTRAGLYLTRVQGEAQVGNPAKDLEAAYKGKAVSQGQVISLSPSAQVQGMLAERVSLGLIGPARLEVEELRGRRSSEKLVWQARLKLLQGCLWLDQRYNFDNPIELNIDLPSGSLKPGAKARWLLQVDAQGGERLAFLDANGNSHAALRDKRGGLQAVDDAANSPVAESALECPGLFEMAQQPVPLLVLSDDYDQNLKHRPAKPALGPGLVEVLSSVPGLSLVDWSGSTRLAKRASAAFKNGGEGLARRVGRELGARWVLLGNSTVRELKSVPQGRKGKKKKTHVLYALAEARLLDVATGDLLATDSASTRVAYANAGLRPHAAREALEGVAAKFGGFIAFQLRNLLRGEAHPTRLISLTFYHLSFSQAVDLRERLSSLDVIQRIFPRKFQKQLLKLDVLLRVPQAEFEKQIGSLKLENAELQRKADSEAGGLEFDVRPAR